MWFGCASKKSEALRSIGLEPEIKHRSCPFLEGCFRGLYWGSQHCQDTLATRGSHTPNQQNGMSEGLWKPVNWEIIVCYFSLWIMFFLCLLLLGTVCFCLFCLFFSLCSLYIHYCLFLLSWSQGQASLIFRKLASSCCGRSSLSFGTSGPAGDLYVYPVYF